MTPTPQNAESLTTTKGLRVLVLGPLRHRLHVDEFDMPFPADGSHRAFWESMSARFPEIGANQHAIRLARRSHFLSPDEPINPGDEIALIPPVSGG